MLGKDISNAMGGIADEKLVAAMQVYEKKQRSRTVWFRVAAMAATLALLLTPWGELFAKPVDPTEGSAQAGASQAPVVQTPVTLFAITVSANDEAEVDLETTEGATAYSSIAAEEEIENTAGKPAMVYNQETGEIETYEATTVNSTFRINIWPNEHVPDMVPIYYEVIYKDTSEVVTTEDEHLTLWNFVFKTFDDGSVATGVGFSGWLTEPTDVIVNLYDRGTDELIQQMTFSITPAISSAAAVNNAEDGSVNIEGYLIEMTEIKQY